MEPLVFSSKRDAWLVVVLWATVAVMLVSVPVPWLAGAPLWLSMLLGAVSLFFAVLTVWTMVGTRYVLTENQLRIVSGPFRWRVPFAQIRAVYPTRSPLSSPALSLDRLAVERDGQRGWLMISPQDKFQFMSLLASRAHNLEVVGDGLRRI